MTAKVMADYILLMHDDAPEGQRDHDPGKWATYLGKLKKAGVFQGGSSIGDGICTSKSGPAATITGLSGYIRVQAESLTKARELVVGNPVFEAGGTVEIRELLKD